MKKATEQRLIYPFLDPRTPRGFLSLLFWSLFVVFVFLPGPVLAIPLAVILVLSVSARFFPIQAHIVHSRVLALFTRGKTREVNELFGMLASLGTMDIGELNRRLTTNNELVRTAVMQELRDRGSRNRETAAALIRLMKMSTADQLPEILQTLGKTADRGVLPEITAFLAHTSGAVRDAAVWCLAEIGSRDVIPALADAFISEQDDIARKGTFAALQKLGGLDVLQERWPSLSPDAKVLCLRSTAQKEAVPGAGMFFSLAERDADVRVQEAAQQLKREYLLGETARRFPALSDREIGKRSAAIDMAVGKLSDLQERLHKACGLDLPANVESDLILSARFLYEGDDEGSDVISVTLKPALQPGWHIEALFTLSDLMNDLSAGEASGCFFLDCPERVRTAFKKPFIGHAHAFDDSRDYFTVRLSGMPVEIYRKYALCFGDMAVLRGNAGTAVQLAVLFYGLFEGGEEIPPFVICFDLLEALCKKRTVFLPDRETEDEVTSPNLRKGAV